MSRPGSRRASAGEVGRPSSRSHDHLIQKKEYEDLIDPVKVVGERKLVQEREPYGNVWSFHWTKETRAPSVERVAGIQEVMYLASAHHAITTRGGLFSFGKNSRDIVGDRGMTAKAVDALRGKAITQVAFPGEQNNPHSLAVTTGGDVYAWGAGGSGQLGQGSSRDSDYPQRVEDLSGIYICRVACGSDLAGGHSLALSEDGRVFSWGYNANGQLGVGNRTEQYRPVSVETLRGSRVVDVAAGWRHSAALTDKGFMFTFGSNRHGQCGHSGLKGEDCLSPKLVAALKSSELNRMWCFGHMTFATTRRMGELYQWGKCPRVADTGKRVNEGVLVPERLEGPKDVIGVVAATDLFGSHIAAWCTTGEVYTWGNGASGRLGHGNTESIDTPKRVDGMDSQKVLSVGLGSDLTGGHTVFLTDEGKVYACGRSGGLLPKTIDEQYRPMLVNALADKQIRQIRCGARHTVLLIGSPEPNGITRYDKGLPMVRDKSTAEKSEEISEELTTKYAEIERKTDARIRGYGMNREEERSMMAGLLREVATEMMEKQIDQVKDITKKLAESQQEQNISFRANVDSIDKERQKLVASVHDLTAEIVRRGDMRKGMDTEIEKVKDEVSSLRMEMKKIAEQNRKDIESVKLEFGLLRKTIMEAMHR
uniref:RCC1-like domain-containing protein n=1 Tax=Palpitomonas bilix TaxID=652834 RepID=A0A7S3G0F1_9EUKA|mmetsp:Transcript_15618/g.39630  ORF Transcript_15618/g.39630 Transcript_15618/m.39630 type:complete len:651 (+) Transcript_15618:250-2202(+)